MPSGLVNDSAKDILRKHLSPAFKGPAWDALLDAVAGSDENNFELARLAFDQLFISTASDKYLDQRGQGEGLARPVGVGMNDDVYRSLVILATNNKLSLNSLLDVLELYYGPESIRAWVQSAAGPFALVNGDELSLTFDNGTNFVKFTTADFTSISAATPEEVVAAINGQLHVQASNAFAHVYLDPDGNKYVRMYSASRGLRAKVQATGVAALGFPATAQGLRQGFQTALVNKFNGSTVVTLPVSPRIVERTTETASYLPSPTLKLNITSATVSIVNGRAQIRAEAVGADSLVVGQRVWLDGLVAEDGDVDNLWPGGALNGLGKVVEVGTGYVVMDVHNGGI